MVENRQQKIMSTVFADAFVGREEELGKIVFHANNDDARALMLFAKPAAGTTELLCQAYDRLFLDDGDIVPFFFEFRPTDTSVRGAAIRFLQTFLTQFTAARRGDASINSLPHDVCELSELAAAADVEWIRKLVATCNADSELNDEASFVRNALSAPFRAAIDGTPVFPMIGGLEYAGGMAGSIDLFELIKEMFAVFEAPFLLSGKRRFLAGGVRKGITRFGSFESLEVGALSSKQSAALCETLGDSTGVQTNPQTRDLIGLQMNGSPLMISSLFQSAAEKDVDLDSFKQVEQSYIEELFTGRLRGYFDSSFEYFSANTKVQRQLIDLIFGSCEFSRAAAPAESWNQTLGLDQEQFKKIMGGLNSREFINSSSNLVSGETDSLVFNDYLQMRFRLEVERSGRPTVYGDALTHSLKRASELLARSYRRGSAIGLRELLSLFDCQETPLSLLFYNVFKELHKGKPDDEIAESLKSEPEIVTLPQIVYSVNSVSVYGKLSKFTDKERSAVALGFEAGEYTPENETVWIAAEIESKLEADAELTGFWCDRLEMVALMCGYEKYRLWLISPEGFTPEAIEVLNQRNAIGSSRKQIELLIKHLDAEKLIGAIRPDNAFEMVVPMGEDTELIAAHAVEEIARRHNFGAKAINQIKTALVEACINATEHSKSPDRKIYQRFEVVDGKIIITISNRGIRFKGDSTREIQPSEGRRGWGLKLMRALMDEVRFEQVDDGTRISMTKNLVAPA